MGKWMLSVLLALSLLGSWAFADVAVGPMYAVFLGVPVMAIAVIVIVLALILRTISRSRGQAGTSRHTGKKHDGSQAGRDANGGRCDWRDKDPWDIDRE